MTEQNTAPRALTSPDVDSWITGTDEDIVGTGPMVVESHADVPEVPRSSFHTASLSEKVELLSALGISAAFVALAVDAFINIPQAVTGGLSFILF